MSLRRALVWVAAVAALAAPPIHGWIHPVMPRLLLLEVPAWIALGALATRHRCPSPRAWNPHGLTGLVFFLGVLGFWMIPRSVDLTSSSLAADQLMHVSLLASGAALAVSVPSMPFVLRGALGIYGASMTFALGMIYTSYSALLCGTFDLAQQKETGHLLLTACPLVVLVVVGSGARALLVQVRASNTNSSASEAVATRARRSGSRRSSSASAS